MMVEHLNFLDTGNDLPMLKIPETPFSKRVKLRHPVIAAPSGDTQGARQIIAAIGATGGLGCLGAKDLTCDEMITAVKAVQTLCRHPFAVHVACYDETHGFLTHVKALLHLQVPVICFEGALPPEPLLRRLRLQKTVLIGIAATRQGLQTLTRGNLDFLVYLGTLNAFPMDKDHQALIPLFKNSPVPLLAACSQFSRHTLSQWVSIGAAGIQVGLPYNRGVSTPSNLREKRGTLHPNVQPIPFLKV